MKNLQRAALLALALGLGACATTSGGDDAAAGDASAIVDACRVLPADVVSRIAGVPLGQAHASSFMDAMQMSQCHYDIQGGGTITFAVLDFARPNPDPAKQVKDRKPKPSECRSFAMKDGPVIACVGDTPRFGLSVFGPIAVINVEKGSALVVEAQARLGKLR